MSNLQSSITLNAIRLYGYHGVSSEEQQVGSWFEIDVAITADVATSALEHDDLSGTIDYSEALRIVKQEFATTSRLLENLAYRVSRALLEAFPTAQQVGITVRKMAPPMPGNVRSAGFRLSLTREAL